MDRIIIRTNVLNKGSVNSAFIELCNGEVFKTTKDFLEKYSFKKVMMKLFCEKLLNDNLENSDLYKDFMLSSKNKKDNKSFIVAYKIDNEFAVHLTSNIYLYHIIEKKDNIYTKLVPWYYADSKKYIGDTWWEKDEEILHSIERLPVIEFFKKYKGY